MLFESVVKNNWNGNFSDFINFQGKKQVWHILSNSAKVAGFITCNYIYIWQRSNSSLVDNKNSSVYFSGFADFFNPDICPFLLTNACLPS